MHGVSVALIFNAFDLLSGIVAAVKDKDLQSSKLRDGIFKKAGFLLCYALAILIDTEGSYIGMKLEVEILPIIVAYVVLTETVSIIENISRLNPELLPDKLLEMFHVKQ